MAKFVMECPECGKFVEAKKGFFASKKIKCDCGNIINVKTDKMTSRVCPHCGNTVVFDQSKGKKAKCPVCHEPINTMNEQTQVEEFSCGRCGVRLVANKGAYKFECPVCDFENDVQERIMAEKIKKEGLASVIKYEGDNNTFVWKHPIEDFNMGSQLIVHESQEAIFFRDGQALDLFGSGRYTLETQQLPLLEKIYKLPADNEATFHAEVYFINKTVQMAIKWGTPEKVRFVDPLTMTPLELGAYGHLNMKVSDPRKLIVKLVGTTGGIAWDDNDGFTKSINASFRPVINATIKSYLPAIIRENQIDLLQIDEHTTQISEELHKKMLPAFEEYGLTIPEFYVTNIVLPEEDPNFKRIKELHTVMLQSQMYQAEATVKTAKARSEAAYRTAEEQSRAEIEAARRQAELEFQTTETEIKKKDAERRVIEAQAEATSMRIKGLTGVEVKKAKGLTEAEVMKAKGYSEQDVLQADVQKAYAAGLGQMGANGGGGAIGDIAGLGVTLGAMGGLMGMTKEAMSPMFGATQATPETVTPNMQPQQPQPQQPIGDTWNCTCGQTGIIGNFCSNCGAKRPVQEIPDTWDCVCGNKGITGNFCSNCGVKRPVQEVSATWDCACGQTGITGNFCSNCGAKRPIQEIPDTWDCVCGNTGITGKFCSVCGRKRGE